MDFSKMEIKDWEVFAKSHKELHDEQELMKQNQAKILVMIENIATEKEAEKKEREVERKERDGARKTMRNWLLGIAGTLVGSLILIFITMGMSSYSEMKTPAEVEEILRTKDYDDQFSSLRQTIQTLTNSINNNNTNISNITSNLNSNLTNINNQLNDMKSEMQKMATKDELNIAIQKINERLDAIEKKR